MTNQRNTIIKGMNILTNTMPFINNISLFSLSHKRKCALNRVLLFVLLFLLLQNITTLHAQTDTIFWFSAPEVNRYHSGGSEGNPRNYGTPVYLRLTTQDLPANVTISMPANPAFAPITRSIAANTTHTENLSAFIINATTTGSGGLPGTTNIPGSIENVLAWTLSNLAPADGKPYINRNNKGIKIVSDAKITAYYEIGVLYNMDLIALKGQNGLGTKFYVPFQTSNNTRDYNVSFRPYSSIDIVATANNTKVNVTITNPIWVKGYGRRLAGTYSIWLDAGQTAIIPAYRNLAGNTGYTGDIYQTTYTNTLRLAGSYVEVDQTQGSGAPVAVITHDDIVVSQFSLNPDYVTDQLVPIEHIGTDYAVIQGVGYNATEIEDHVFVVGTQNGTNFTVKRGPADVTSTHTVDERGSVEISMNNQNYRVVTVNSDRPVYVYHMSGTGRQKAGALIPTISNCTGSTRVAFNRTRSQADGYDFFLSILAWAKAGNSSIGNFRLLKNNVDVSLPGEVGVINAINNPASFNPLPETGVPYENWQYARIDASGLEANVAYMLVNDENVFHLGVINGRTSNDAFYGYFSNFNQFDPSGLVVENNSPGGKFCPGITIQLYAEGGAKYSWNPTDFLDNPNIHNPIASNVTYSVPYQVTVSGACDFSQTLDIPIQVGDPVVANFMPNAFLGCAVPPVPGGTPEYTFTFTSTSQYDSIRTWVYRLGPTGTNTQFAYGHNDLPPADQAHVVDLTLTNNTDGILDYYITLYVQDRLQFCIREVTKVVRVYPYIGVAPTANPTSGCQPLDVNFFANPQGEFVGATYAWEFGDGASHYIQNPTHQFINPSPPYDPLQYYSKVTITDQWNICNATDSVLINVSPYIDARFTLSKVEGCSPLNDVVVTNTSKGAINTYTWTLYRNGTLIHTLAGVDPPNLVPWLVNTRTDNLPDEYLLRLEVNHTTYNCPKQFERTITVWPVPSASTLVTPQPNISCSPLEVDYEATNIINADAPYHWMLDGIPITTSATGTYTLDNYTMAPQTRQMWFELDNIWGCTFASAPVDIEVHPYIEANIVLNPEEICPDPVTGLFEVDILDASLLADGYYQWTINGVDEPINTDVGTRQFDYSTLALNGDGSADIPVSLTVTNGAGCVSTDNRTIFVKPWVTGSFTAAVEGVPITAGVEILCSPVTIDFTSSMTHSDSYFWQFGTQGASVDENPSFEFTNTGDTPLDVVVTLTANSSFGCSAVHTETYTIQPEVRAEYSLNTTAGCTPLTIVVEAPNLAGVTYQWNFNGETPTGNAPTFTTIPANTTGGYLYLPITLTATRGLCTATNTDQIITVYPDVDAKWSGTPLDPTCSPANLSLNNTSDVYNPALPVTNIQWQVFDPSDVLVESSSNQLFEPELTNTSHLVTQDYRIRLDATSIDGCTDFYEETITIYPTPNALFNITVIENCTPMVIDVTDASTTISQADYTWDWDGEDDLTNLGNQNYRVTYENTHPTNEEVKLIVLDLENQYGCVDSYGYQFSVLPQVNASIALAAGSLDRLCGSEEIIFENFSTGGSPGTLTFSWDFDDGTSPYVTTSYNPVPHTFTNNTTNPLYRDVTLTVTNSSGCTNDAPVVIPITVYPRVVAAQSFEIVDVCSGTTIDLTNASSNATVPNSTFVWEFTTTSPQGVNQTVTYPSGPLGGINLVNGHLTDPIIYNVGFTASTLWNPGGDEHTCSNAITGEDVTVYPLLDVIYDSPAAVCSGLNGAELEFIKNASSSGGYETDVVLEWWFGDGNTMSTNFVPSVNKLIENLSDVDFITQTRIFARQVATGCTQEQFVDVRVHPKVEARFTSTIHDNDNCAYPLRVDFENSSVFHDLQPGVDTYFHWNYGNSGEGGTPAEETRYDSNPHHWFFYNAQPNAIATYDVTLTVNQYHEISGATCADDSVKTVTVYPELIADFSLGPPSGCNPLTVTYNNQSSGVLQSQGGNYEWDLGDNTGSILETPGEKIYSHTDKTQSLFFPVTLTVTNPLGCTKEITQTIEVFPLVIADFFADITQGCTPLTVTVQNTSTSPQYLYNWNFQYNGMTSTLEQPGSRIFVNEPTTPLSIYTPTITLTTGLNALTYGQTCAKTATQQITVFPHIYPDFTGDLEDCHPHTVDFSNTTNAFGGTSNATYLWSFGNSVSSSQINPSQTYYNTSFTQDATFPVKLKATSEHGCKDSIVHNVLVHPKPKAAMELLSQYISCPPLEAIFDNQSLGTYLTYHYDFGDGTDSTTTSADNMHHYYGNDDEDEPKPYVITLTSTTEFGCEDFTTQTVYVFPEVHVDFAFDPNTGCNPHTPTIYNYTSASAFYYNWDFDDGFTSYLFEPIHRFVNTTTEDRVFNVSLNAVSTYDCEDTQTRPLTVYAAPIAEFAINPPLSVFPNATFQMINYSNPADPSWNYLWNYGDGYGDDQAHLGTHSYTYETWGPKENNFRRLVTLEIWNENCYDSVWHYLTLLPPLPIVLFEAEHYQSCSPLEVYFINNSMYGDSCLWDFGYFDDEGNPVTSKEWEPYHVFVEPGYYNVGLTVWGDGGENHYFATFQVWVNPVAAFAVLPERVMLPQATVRLFNLSENAYRSIWDLGDGTITTVRDPIHTYRELGEYRITLTVYTEYGCEDTDSRYPAVWVEGAGYISFPNAFVPSPHGSNGGYYDAVDFANEVFHPYSDGVIEYRLMIFNRWGEQIFETNDIKVGWDGYYKDKLCDQGVYVWRAVGRFANGKQFNLKGNVTLLR